MPKRLVAVFWRIVAAIGVLTVIRFLAEHEAANARAAMRSSREQLAAERFERDVAEAVRCYTVALGRIVATPPAQERDADVITIDDLRERRAARQASR